MNFAFTLLAFFAAPLLPGVVNKTKAFFAGREGPSVFQLYYDLAKLFRKSSPRSHTSTWIFDLAPTLSLSALTVAAAMFPWSSVPCAGFSGAASIVLFFYLLGTARFFTVLGAMDVGSAFEGMGASREVQFSAIVEIIVFVLLGFLVMLTGETSLTGVLSGADATLWWNRITSMVLAGAAFFVVALSENCRVPFDDPETHLELTMIHEAMILDNAGADLAFILYGAALKFEILMAFLIAMLMPKLDISPVAYGFLLIALTLASGMVVGTVESVMARMRFLKMPQILVGAIMSALLAVLLLLLF